MYANGSSIFRIESERKFSEVQKMGNRYELFEVEATIYPDILRIQDMIAKKDGHWLEATAEAFEQALSEVAT